MAKEEGEAERARLDERWDRLAAGTLTAEEDAELRALAAKSPEARETYEAFRPLGADFQARMIDRIAAELAKPAAPEERRSRILPFRPFWRAGWLTAAAAAAAVLLLLLRSPASLPPLPMYMADQPAGGVQAFRGGISSQSFTPGSTLSLVVRPQHPVTGKVAARAFLARGAEWLSWEPEIEVSQGGIRLQGELPRELQPGGWRLWVVVGRPARLPPIQELRAEVRAGKVRHDAWQAVPADLRVEAQAPP
ncbi:MAG TPA: hypothetical protein VGM86_32675 [Thermoanaerobaculia bacterium]